MSDERRFTIGQQVVSTHKESVIVGTRFYHFPVGSRGVVAGFDSLNPDKIAIRYHYHPKWRIWTAAEWFEPDNTVLHQPVVDLQAELKAMRADWQKRQGGA